MQHSQPTPPAEAIKRTWGSFLKFCSWCWGIIAILLGIGYVWQWQLLGGLSIAFGVVMLPPTRRMIQGMFGFRLIHPGVAGVAILAVLTMIIRDITVRKEFEQERVANPVRTEQPQSRQGNQQSNMSAPVKLQPQSTSETYNGHPVYIGPRGGRYYINDKGNKVYIK